MSDDEVGEELDHLMELCEADFGNYNPTPWEREFLGSLRERLEQYGDRTFVSPKQRGVIERIKQKVAEA